MKRSVLIIVTSDPRKSGLAAEAVRIAAGLSSHERLAVTLCLSGAATQILREDCADFVDGDHFAQYLPVLAQAGRIIFAAADSIAPGPDSSPSSSVRPLSEAQLQALLACSDRVLRF